MASAAFTTPLLDLLFEESRVGRCLVAPDGSILRASAEWLRSTGLSLDAVLGVDVIELLPEPRDVALAMHARVGSGHRVEVPRHARTVNGRETFWEGSIDPVPMEGGTGLLISAREVPGPLADPHRVEEALRHATELLELGGAILELDREFRVVTVNAAQERISRTPRTVSVGRVFWDVWPEVQGTRYVEEFRRCMKKRVTVQFEEYYAPLDVWTNVTAYPTSSGGIAAFFRDVTAQKRAAEALAAETEKYRALFQNSLDAVYLSRADGTILDANPAACQLHGMTADEIKQAGRAGLVVNDDRHAAALKARETAGRARAELTVRRKDGTTVPVEVESVLLDSARTDSAAFVISRDISARKRADEELRANLASTRRAEAGLREAVGQYERQARLFDGVASTTPDFVYVFDLQGRFLYANRRLLEVWGMQPAEVIGKTCREIGYEQWHHDMHMREIAQVIETRRPIKGEVPFTAPRTGICGVYEYIFTPVLGPDGQVETIAGTTRDVTERKRSEEALRDANEQLRDVDRHKTEFLAVLSHELRNPLAPVRNSIYLLERTPPGSEQAARARRVLHRQTEHLTRLVDDLLDITRISRGKIDLKLERLDLRDVVRKTMDDLHAGFEDAGIELRVEQMGFTPVWVDADPTRVSQVFANLLQNAAKFTPNGGSVTVLLASDGERAELRVGDTGVGMDPASIAGMFEPFAQADHSLARTQGGLGLGLALVKALVELHGGTVEARSAGIGKGAEFVVRLPVSRFGAGTAPGPEAPERRSRSVVIIEDNNDAAETLADVLALAGHRVSIARNGRSGIELVRRVRPDVVLCDVGLPDIDGYEVARAVRADPSLGATRLVALSGYAQSEDRQRASEAGFSAHIAKPPDPDELDRLLASRS